MCDMTQFVIPTTLFNVTSSDLVKAFMENVLLKFGICIVLIVDDGSTFMGIFIHMAKALNIRLYKAENVTIRRWEWNSFILF